MNLSQGVVNSNEAISIHDDFNSHTTNDLKKPIILKNAIQNMYKNKAKIAIGEVRLKIL